MRQPDQSARATVADLYNITGKTELVDGNIVRMPPTGGRPSEAATEIVVSLHAYARKTSKGRAVADNTGFLVQLPNRQSLSPDAAYWDGAAPSMKFYSGAPVFAVEVRSEHDYGTAAERAMANKRADYFAAGTQVVWDVDLLSNATIAAYHADYPDIPRIYHRGDIADAEPAVKGWLLPVNDLFRE